MQKKSIGLPRGILTEKSIKLGKSVEANNQLLT